MTAAPTKTQQALHRRLALRFVIGIGVVSLFARLIYSRPIWREDKTI